LLSFKAPGTKKGNRQGIAFWGNQQEGKRAVRGLRRKRGATKKAPIKTGTVKERDKDVPR